MIILITRYLLSPWYIKLIIFYILLLIYNINYNFIYCDSNNNSLNLNVDENENTNTNTNSNIVDKLTGITLFIATVTWWLVFTQTDLGSLINSFLEAHCNGNGIADLIDSSTTNTSNLSSDQIESLVLQNKALHCENTDLKIINKELRRTLSVKSDEVDTLTQTTASLRQDMVELIDANSQQASKIDVLSYKNTILKKKFELATNRINQVKEALEKSKDINQKLFADNKEMFNLFENQKKQLQSVLDDSNLLKMNFEESRRKAANWYSENQDLNQQLRNLELEYTTLIEENNALKNMNTELIVENEQLQKRISDATQQEN